LPDFSDANEITASAVSSRPRKRQHLTDLGLLMQLGAWKNPGLSVNEFLDLINKFVRCKCGLIMTFKRFLGEHKCAIKGLGYINFDVSFNKHDSETEQTTEINSESECQASDEE
jgi:hypothetical protein